MSSNVLVKNMVCQRCVTAVKEILRSLEVSFQDVMIGEIHGAELTAPQRESLTTRLNSIGFELIDDRTGGLIEKIKSLVIKKARNEVDEKDAKLNLSNYLSAHLHHEYTYLSSLFSSVEGRTIENYFIEQRIEKAKELLIYGELNLSQIAFDLEYSSLAHLSTQFKKVTGLTPSHFKQIGAARRKSLDSI
jgi:AraC family transcriptional regulator